MTVISSQRYLDNSILTDKIAEIEASQPAKIVLQTWSVGIDDLEILFDGHHTLEAAHQCEIAVRFESVNHPEGLTGEDLLEQAWLDSDWYDIETGSAVF